MEGHSRYRIDTESPIQKRPILLDRSDLILAESFDPYLSLECMWEFIKVAITEAVKRYVPSFWVRTRSHLDVKDLRAGC